VVVRSESDGQSDDGGTPLARGSLRSVSVGERGSPQLAEQPETWVLEPHSVYRVEGWFTLKPTTPTDPRASASRCRSPRPACE
jgi:hypothetical protein